MPDPNTRSTTTDSDPRVIAEHVLTDYVRQASRERVINDTVNNDDTQILHPGDRVVLEYTMSFENQTVSVSIDAQHDVAFSPRSETTERDSTRFFVECYVETRTGADKVAVTSPKVIGYNITSEAVENTTTSVRRQTR